MIRWQLRLLGSFELVLAGEPAAGSGPEKSIRAEKSFRSQSERALLAYLACEAGRPHSREELSALLWPELPGETAHNNLRVTLHRLRQVLGDPDAAHPLLHVSRDAIQLVQAGQLWVDVAAFQELLTRVEQHPHENLAACAACLAGYAETAVLYQGDFLQGVYPAESLPFAEWALLKREHLHRQALHALYLLAVYHQRMGELDQALGYARRQLELEPWREEAHCQVMTLLALQGERSAALRQYERCRQLLQEELGVEPAEETHALYERILASRMERRHNLPMQPTPFLGRKLELNQVSEILADPDCRLLTLLGPGGIGKSRLAAQAAQAQVYAFLQGVFLVPLAGLTTQADVVRAIAGELDFQLRPAGDPKTQLLDYLRAKEMLLVLDNYEQLLGPGVPSGTGLLEDLLAHAPGLQFLVTSRQRLNLRQERVMALQGLSFPDEISAPDVENFAAVQLFLHSARRVDPAFQPLPDEVRALARICWLLEGVPLAIELAAAWVRVISPGQIAQEIERDLDFLATSYPDLPERQRSLRATFEHSYQLLTHMEQRALCRLAVFPGSFERTAAEEVAVAPLSVLTSLCDRSLLEYLRAKEPKAQPRYRMHELIRQFSREKLADEPAEEGQAFDRHRRFYMRFLNERNALVMGGQASPRAGQEVSGEFENMRPALERAITGGELHELCQSLNILMYFYEINGQFAEAQSVYERISLSLAEGINTRKPGWQEACYHLGRAMMYHGWYWMHLAHPDQAIELTQKGLALSQQAGDLEGYALGLNSLGLFAGSQGKYPEAESYLRQALSVCEEHLYPWSQAGAASNLGHLAMLQGDLPLAAMLFQQSLDLYIRLNDDWGKAGSLDSLGEVALRQGDLELAEQRFRQCIEIRQKLGQRWRVALSLNRLGELAYRRQQYTEAKRDHQECLAILRDFGERNHLAVTLVHIGEACSALGDNMEARESFHESLQFAQEIGAEGTLVQALVGLAMLLANEGEQERSAAILAAVSGHPSIAQEDRIRAGSLLGELQEALAPQLFQAALENGGHHSLQDLVAFILTSGGLERLAFVDKTSQA